MYYYVELNSYDKDAKATLVMRFKLYDEDKVVAIELISPFNIDTLLREDNRGYFIVGQDRKKRVYLNQGLLFLDTLKYAFSGSRLRASDVYKDEGNE